MILKIQLNSEEYQAWGTPEGKERLIRRCRELSTGADIDRVSVQVDALHAFELAPTSHEKMAVRLRELGMRHLADLVDPEKNPDDESRAKYADQLVRYGEQYSVPGVAEGDE